MTTYMLAAISVGLTLTSSNSRHYLVADLGTLGGTSSSAISINNLGDVVGFSKIAGDVATHAFAFIHGSMRDLGTFGGPNSIAWGINDSDAVVGEAEIAPGVSNAFLWTTGLLQNLGTLGGQFVTARGINNHGDIVGYSAISGFMVPRHAFRYSGGSMEDLGTLGGMNSVGIAINSSGEVTGGSDIGGNVTDHVFTFSSSILDLDNADSNPLTNGAGYGINSAGDVVGSGLTANNVRPGIAVLYRSGTITQLGSLGNSWNVGLGINDSDDIVGHSSEDSDVPQFYGGASVGFLWSSGTLYDLNDLVTTPGWTIWDATAINNKGQIAGTGIFQGQYHAIRLDPAVTLQDIIDLIESFGLSKGTTTSLVAKLNAAATALAAGDTASARADIGSLISETKAQSGKKLTAAQASAIIADANQILTQLGS